MMKHHKALLLLASLLALALPVLAQPDNPDPPTPLPGIAWLLAAGAAFGAKKVYEKKRHSK